MKMPVQKPGKSNQSVGTPDNFLAAVFDRFGGFTWDLAADEGNSVCGNNYFDEKDDSLSKPWHQLAGNLWLNPPFSNIAPWVEKAAWDTSGNQCRVFVLVPASVGSNWFHMWVHNKAYVLALNPRLTFKGHKTAYPKDLLLLVYGAGFTGFNVWRWK